MENINLEERAAAYILECNLDQLRELTVSKLTRYFKVSKAHLTNKFKQGKGITPGKFILREKMVRAALLMERDGQLTVKKLTEIMGFSACDYFIRIFKHHLGLSPKKYREIRINGCDYF